MKCQTDTVKMLLAKGADVNAKDDYGYTALIWAAYLDYSDIVQILLEHGAKVNIKNNHGESPLLLAVKICSSKYYGHLL
jgi:ankyrin repeat protein